MRPAEGSEAHNVDPPISPRETQNQMTLRHRQAARIVAERWNGASINVDGIVYRLVSRHEVQHLWKSLLAERMAKFLDRAERHPPTTNATSAVPVPVSRLFNAGAAYSQTFNDTENGKRNNKEQQPPIEGVIAEHRGHRCEKERPGTQDELGEIHTHEEADRPGGMLPAARPWS